MITVGHDVERCCGDAVVSVLLDLWYRLARLNLLPLIGGQKGRTIILRAIAAVLTVGDLLAAAAVVQGLISENLRHCQHRPKQKDSPHGFGRWNDVDVECGMWNVECGMRNVECGMWNVDVVADSSTCQWFLKMNEDLLPSFCRQSIAKPKLFPSNQQIIPKKRFPRRLVSPINGRLTTGCGGDHCVVTRDIVLSRHGDRAGGGGGEKQEMEGRIRQYSLRK
jgi:hypothetical protein